MPGAIHTFSYPVGRHDRTRPVHFSHTRDELACREVFAALLETGQYVAGEPILNHPGREPLVDAHDLHRKSLYRLDLPPMHSGDLILHTIRNPTHDLYEGARKQVEPGNTDLEAKIFRLYRPYLDVCARNWVRLSEALRSRLRPEHAGYREMHFYMGTGAWHRELNALDGKGRRRPRANPRRTSLFILNEPEIEPNGPGYLNAFGMDAMTTLIWAYRLHRDCSEFLHVPGFSMFEMEAGPIPERPTDLRWCLDWKIEPVVHYHAR